MEYLSASDAFGKYQAVIFDCDDTIIATAKTRWAVLIKTAAKFGKRLDENTIRAAWGRPFNEMIASIVPSVNFDEFIGSYRTAITSTNPEATRGAIRLVSQLRERGVAMDIVTSSSRDLIVQDLDKLDLTQYFSNILGYLETEYHKPDPRVLSTPIQSLEQRGFHRSEIIYIGDSVRDFKAARGSELGFIAVLSGLDGEQHFLEEGHPRNLIVDSLERLIDH
jgi:HAD superfamily hydrolase (TIGR01549 family)